MKYVAPEAAQRYEITAEQHTGQYPMRIAAEYGTQIINPGDWVVTEKQSGAQFGISDKVFRSVFVKCQT